MADIPLCPNCQRSLKVKAENEMHWCFQCPYCKTTRIISKPTMRGASRLENALARQSKAEQIDRYLNSRPSFSFPSNLGAK